ncbi:trafficking protein particle complex subunit 10 [Diplogelasinospora grovesii]|uniref:Trafficking protein particle complex subunit 10 n=1 Tax=Diplogelasinospora grovesii TaxID=303347 RepID=A0AAN6S4K2_9PEZI|nr:trafficking protein particle complex subunit 10 [Diplogelasinospora grovesii]
MEQPFSSSKVTVEYFDPHDVYKLLAPGLIPRLPLRDLHWQSHAGPLRSINTLHVELVPAGADVSAVLSPLTSPNPPKAAGAGGGRSDSPAASRDDGFSTASVGGRPGSIDRPESMGSATLRPPGAVAGAGKERRHQIPGLRRTPYLKVLLVRCDDNDTYKSTTRAEIREWIKTHTPAQGKSTSTAENHDAFEWLIIHVVIPNTVAATQPRMTGSKAADSSSDVTTKSSTTSRWRGGSSTLLEKLRSDFNGGSKSGVDHVAQIRIGINDVPYDHLPRVVPAVPTGYMETEQDAENAWMDLIGKFKELILSSFDMRVSQYEEDIKEKDAQRSLPGWNFCTFFILKEGLARGFESVGLVEDALVGYDELSVRLDNIMQEQAISGSAEAHGGALLSFTDELRDLAQRALAQVARGNMEFEDVEAVDLQSREGEGGYLNRFDKIPISSTKKPYRELILANNVSLFDFRCYIFARQISLLLRLGNAWSTREELLAKLKEQQESVLHGVAPRAPPPKPTDESENLSRLAEICGRALEFIPAVSQAIRRDIVSAMTRAEKPKGKSNGDGDDKPLPLDPMLSEIVDNIAASFAFSVAQQILAQTSTKALPIPPSTLTPGDGHEQKTAIPEPKTMMHPARSTSLNVRPGQQRSPHSPVGFPGPGRRSSLPEGGDPAGGHFLRAGLEELAARRAELYTLSRNVLEECGKKRGWTDGWASVPIVGESGIADMDDVSLDDVDLDDDAPAVETDETKKGAPEKDAPPVSMAGLDNELLRTALDNKDDFYRLYETLTDKALRHYTVASHSQSVHANMADLAILKYHLQEYEAAAFHFFRTIPFFGESGWSLLELSMLVMYAKCLKELRRMDDYVNKALLKLLCKAAAAEHDKIQQSSSLRVGSGPKSIGQKQYPERSAISGFLADLLTVSTSLEKEVKIPLTSFFCDVEIEGSPVYDDGQDSFSLCLKMRSLLVDEFEAQVVGMRIVNPAAGGHKEIWLRSKGPVVIKSGRNKVWLQSSAIMAGTYEVDQIYLSNNKVSLHFEREIGQPTAVDKSSALSELKNPRVTLYQRARSLDVELVAARDLYLDRPNSLDLEVLTGWNSITAAEIKVKSATGGLRLLMSEAAVSGEHKPTKRADGGSFSFGPVPEDTTLKISIPYKVEQDMLSVAIKVEVSYATDRGEGFSFAKTTSVPVALALGVNVQDVFKHDALFSRFTVSTATASPLRLFKSELLASDLFESSFGAPPSNPVMVFPKQPAGLLYKITRKPGSENIKITPKTKKTMFLKIYYSVLQDEIEALFEESLGRELEGSGLGEYSKLVVSTVLAWVQTGLTPAELESCGLLGEVSTGFLSRGVKWDKLFSGMGTTAQEKLAGFMTDWLQKHTKLSLPQPKTSVEGTKSLLIPVDIPSITIVHTADIRFSELPSVTAADESGGGAEGGGGGGVVCVNQLLPATLHLKWTRIWDTGSTTPESTTGAGVGGGGRSEFMGEDLEFSYEVTAPSDTWLLGGRRKGHFVIPAVEADGSGGGLTSTPDTEADIPLLLVPLREGWLPFPTVDIREVKSNNKEESSTGSGSGSGGGGHGHCEIDYRNVGETVRVIADRARVTLSLDASGPGGGPLVLESERWSGDGLELGGGGRVVA